MFSINRIFIFLYLLGCSQAFLYQLYGINIFLIKNILLAIMIVLFIIKILSAKIRLSKYTFALILLYIFYIVSILIKYPELLTTGNQQVVGLWSLANIPLLIIFSANSPTRQGLNKFSYFLVLSGVIASIYGMLQMVLGPENLTNMGLNLESNKFLFVGQEFRPFSFFASHYEFASFQSFSIISAIYYYQEHGFSRSSIAVLTIIIMGLLLTLNITLWIVVLITILIIYAPTFSIKWVKYLSVSSLSFAILVYTINPIYERLLTLFNISYSSGGAGQSLYYRVIAYKNSFQLISNNIYGYGNSVFSLSKDTFLTSDNYFVWMLLYGGLVLFTTYLLIHIVPLVRYYLRRTRDSNREKAEAYRWILFSYATVNVFVGGLSNYAVVMGTPTNILFWASLGLMSNYSFKDIDKFKR